MTLCIVNFICRRFGTPCLFHLHKQVFACTRTYLPMKMEQTECSETSAYTIQTPGNYPEESIQHSEHGESLKSRMPFLSESLMLETLISNPSLVHCSQSVHDFEHLWRLCDDFLAINITHFQQVFFPELHHSGAPGDA